MKSQVKFNLINVLNRLISAHQAMQPDSDFHTQSLICLIEELEGGAFFQKPKEEQALFLAGIRGKYTGKGEVLWSLTPKYLDEDFLDEFREAFSFAIEGIRE